MVANGYTVPYMMKLVGDDLLVMATCVEPGGFQNVVMANLLGSGGLQVTVSSRIDPFPPWDSNLRPTLQRF